MGSNKVEGRLNPFEVTKATDFDDRQIAATWVEFPGAFDPRSPVATFIFGGKGSGRTHLMRYHSSSVQVLRIAEGASGLTNEGYVGVYVNASALNAGRFKGKGQDDEKWEALFSYYFDLWLGARMLIAAREVLEAVSGIGPPPDGPIARRASPGLSAGRLHDVGGALKGYRSTLRTLDVAVNDAAMTRELRVLIPDSPGRIVFRTAEDLCGLAGLRDLRPVLLLDEFENFSEAQQRYVNTLLREKQPHVGLFIGARSGGVRTFKTQSGEENRKGSEFATIELDALRLRSARRYGAFCRSLVARRLVNAELFGPEEEKGIARGLPAFFSEPGPSRLGDDEAAFALQAPAGGRKSVARLRQQLEEHRPSGIGQADVHLILAHLERAEHPLIEKLSVYLFYKAWHKGTEGLPEAAARIRREADDFLAGGTGSPFALAMGHFRGDMLAQLLKEYHQRQRYVGFREFVGLSGGLPRGLLVTLKHVFRWSVFNGERPFVAAGGISEPSQLAGVEEAAAWFFQDLPGIGPEGAQAQLAIERLGNFLQALRFSDKPTESSLCTVGVNMSTLTGGARAVVNHCIEFSFLLRVAGGHKDRNTRMRKLKLQVHPTLCPRWDLPTGRRGVLELSADEAAAIFDEERAGQLERVTRIRLRRMNAPFRALDRGGDPNRGLYD